MEHNKLVKILEEDLKQYLRPKRFQHTLNVVEEALKLSKRYEINLEKARIAALFHDYTKNMTLEANTELAKKYNFVFDEIEMDSKELQHSKTAGIIAKELFFQDQDIVEAISYHTTGRANMSMLEKIIFVADAIEKDRKYKDLEELRILAYEDIDKALLQILDNSIMYLVSLRKIIHPNTLYARNYYLNKINEVV